jgi:hypothetical protein
MLTKIKLGILAFCLLALPPVCVNAQAPETDPQNVLTGVPGLGSATMYVYEKTVGTETHAFWSTGPGTTEYAMDGYGLTYPSGCPRIIQANGQTFGVYQERTASHTQLYLASWTSSRHSFFQSIIPNTLDASCPEWLEDQQGLVVRYTTNQQTVRTRFHNGSWALFNTHTLYLPALQGAF